MDIEESSRENEKLCITIHWTSHWGQKEQFPRRANYCVVRTLFLGASHQKQISNIKYGKNTRKLSQDQQRRVQKPMWGRESAVSKKLVPVEEQQLSIELEGEGSRHWLKRARGHPSDYLERTAAKPQPSSCPLPTSPPEILTMKMTLYRLISLGTLLSKRPQCAN